MMQEWKGSRDRVISDAIFDAFYRMSVQGFVGEREANSGVVVGEF
jgi:hypothetical protein